MGLIPCGIHQSDAQDCTVRVVTATPSPVETKNMNQKSIQGDLILMVKEETEVSEKKNKQKTKTKNTIKVIPYGIDKQS